MLENIFRHSEQGKDRLRAAREGTAEITFAALAATVAVIAIFIPIVFMKGIVGRFFLQFGVTLCVAVALSYVEAITLAPAHLNRPWNLDRRRSSVRVAPGFFTSGRRGAAMGLLIRGSVGPLVTKLQEDLTALGYNVEPDGVYGAATEEQVRFFQDAYSLDADGKAGPNTLAKIAELREEIAGMKAKG